MARGALRKLDPRKQGLKKDISWSVSSEDDTSKARSTKTRIEKRLPISRKTEDELSSKARSTKTRIENLQPRWCIGLEVFES